MRYLKGYFITTTPDTGENAGGLFCQVYSDEACDTEVDNFCVHKGEDEDKVIAQNINTLVAERGENLNSINSRIEDSKLVLETATGEYVVVCEVELKAFDDRYVANMSGEASKKVRNNTFDLTESGYCTYYVHKRGEENSPSSYIGEPASNFSIEWAEETILKHEFESRLDIKCEITATFWEETTSDRQDPLFNETKDLLVATGEKWTARVKTCGEISAKYKGEYMDIDDIIDIVGNDKGLEEAVDKGDLEFSLNNWYELQFFDVANGRYDYMDITPDLVAYSYKEVKEQLETLLTDEYFIEELEKLKKGIDK